MIAPRPVGGLAKRPVAALAAAKHHMAAALATGELFTWGCNRDGRLGYPAPDTQATPRRCAPPGRCCSLSLYGFGPGLAHAKCAAHAALLRAAARSRALVLSVWGRAQRLGYAGPVCRSIARPAACMCQGVCLGLGHTVHP